MVWTKLNKTGYNNSCNEPKLITYFKSQTGQAVPSTCKAEGQST